MTTASSASMSASLRASDRDGSASITPCAMCSMRLPSARITPHPRWRVPGSMPRAITPSTVIRLFRQWKVSPGTFGSVASRDPDIVVIGAGPNGLVAACVLAKKGFRVVVVEANPRRPGGAVGSEEATERGFVHDVGAAFFPFAKTSPAFQELELDRQVEWVHARYESCHPAPDGTFACISRDLERDAGLFGSASDGDAWRKLAAWHRAIEPRLYHVLLGPLPALGPALALGPLNLLRLARLFMRSGRGIA